MGFIDFLAYIKHLGEKALVFFPSKTDLISVTDKDGNPTEEMLSERLDTLLSKDSDASNVTVTFQEATEKANIQSGDSLATAFAKLSKFCSSLETLETNVNDSKDKIVKGQYKLVINDNGTVTGIRTMQNPDGSTMEVANYISLGANNSRFMNVYASNFSESGKWLVDKYAQIASPTFTGTPKAPTPESTSNNTSLATTAFVKEQIGDLIGGAPETMDTLKEVSDAIAAHKDVTDALNAAIGNKVNKSGDTMTGDLVIPSKRVDDKHMSVATVAAAGSFVADELDVKQFAKYKSFLGSCTINDIWQAVISVRHRNGANDGNKYGMYLKTELLNTLPTDLKWGRQYGENNWQPERTIVDNVNVGNYAIVKNSSNERVQLKKGYYSHYHQSSSAHTSIGYINFCQLKIKHEYLDSPIIFKINQRRVSTTATITLRFSGGNNIANTSVAIFAKDIPEIEVIICPAAGDKSVWDLYIKKTDGWDEITFDINIPWLYYDNNVLNVIWKDEFIATETAIPNIENATHAVLRDLTVNNIVAANYIGVNELVGANKYTKANPYVISYTSSLWHNTGAIAHLEKGVTYTVSSVLKNMDNSHELMGVFLDAMPAKTHYASIKQTYTFTCEVTGEYTFLVATHAGSITEQSVYDIKLEKGIHATQYVPNLEEMQQTVRNINSVFVELKDASEEKKNDYNFIGSYAKSDFQNGSSGLYFMGNFHDLPILYTTEEMTYTSYNGGKITTITLPIGYYKAKSVLNNNQMLSICNTAGEYNYLGKSYLIITH